MHFNCEGISQLYSFAQPAGARASPLIKDGCSRFSLIMHFQIYLKPQQIRNAVSKTESELRQVKPGTAGTSVCAAC